LSSRDDNLVYREAIALLDDITHVAVTAGPGLIGSLLVGFNAAKSLSYVRNLPIIPVNHIEGLIYSAFSEETPDFPILALTVSGGHTSLTLMKDHGEYQHVGATIDDAVGEAYDKTAKLLGLGYPGGPIISKLANQFREKGKEVSIVFPRPIINDGTFNFSFSGLKTAVLQKVKEIIKTNDFTGTEEIPAETKEEIAYAFENAVADVLCTKLKKAIKKYNPKAVVFAGGVSANNYLRDRLQTVVAENGENIRFLTPANGLSGDNAAMIGVAAYYHISRGDVLSWNKIKVDSNWELID
jgi:N6-L-threonylcarbamoyladenine synthase